MEEQRGTSMVELDLFVFFFFLFKNLFFYFFGVEVTRVDMEGLGSE